MVLGDARFMLMIVVYSGFWILYFQTFGSVLWYLRDFVNTQPVNAFFASFGVPLKFDTEHVTVVNGGTIILLQVLVSRLVKNIRPLPTMVTGIVIGTLGFLCLAASTNVWVFILGLSVFSIGEMTAHPKYYSYVGLVAPSDKKAVYMGYAFLYGVIGSLVGSSLGGTLYGAMLKPVVGTPGAAAAARNFWLIFVALNIVAAIGLVFYDRVFAQDTPETNAKARKVMIGIYGLLLTAGLLFLRSSIWGSAEISYKTMVQAAIMLLLGAGGMAVSLRKNEGSILL
jgi:dipeptide/tripeptide permease